MLRYFGDMNPLENKAFRSRRRKSTPQKNLRRDTMSRFFREIRKSELENSATSKRAGEGIGCACPAGRGQRPSLARRVSKDRHRYGRVSNPSVSRCRNSIRRKSGGKAPHSKIGKSS